MARVDIYDDEWYPVLCYERVTPEDYNWGVGVDVPEEVLAAYDAAEAAFEEAAAKLGAFRKK